MIGDDHCSSLKRAHAFQREGLSNNHTSLKLSNLVLPHFTKKLDIGCCVLNMTLIGCVDILKK